jgi:uncharacterized protein
MKESIYNFYLNDNENNIYLIYNALNNSLIKDDDCRVQKFIQQCNGHIKYNPEYLTEEEFNELIDSGIIAAEGKDEKQSAIDINEKRIEFQKRKRRDTLHLVITPTLSCNFKCYYCFESNNAKKNNSSICTEVQNDIIDFIITSIEHNGIKKVNITWYGGEPLIRQEIIFSMQQRINDICNSQEIVVYAEIITNGVLLSQKTCDLLYELGIKRIQVTIDGPEHIHNKRRYYPVSPANNYNLILENIIKANNKLHFDIRVNIDNINKDFIFDLIDDLIERKIWPYKKNVVIYMAHVETVGKTGSFDLPKKEFTILQDKIRNYLRCKYNEINKTDKAKMDFLYPRYGGEIGCGYGVYENSWVIGYNGDIYRCWETVGQKNQIVGTIKDLLNNFGTAIMKELKIDNKTFEQWGCFNCKFFPVCGAGCPWDFAQNNNSERRCTVWKSILEYRLLSQYKAFLEKPEIFKSIPFGNK